MKIYCVKCNKFFLSGFSMKEILISEEEIIDANYGRLKKALSYTKRQFDKFLW